MSRFAKRLLKGGIRPLLLKEFKNMVVLGYPDRPGLYDVHTKGEYSQLQGRFSLDGMFFWCKGCRCEHLWLWSDYYHAKEQWQQQTFPSFYNILCIDGERLQVAMPGERYEGKHVTCVAHVNVDITSDGENDG